MDLIGKHLGVLMPLEHALAILGAPCPEASREERVFLLARVAGETPQLGLWIEIERMTYDQTEETVVPDLPGDSRKYLLGWGLIPTAVLFDQVPRNQPDVGFHAR